MVSAEFTTALPEYFAVKGTAFVVALVPAEATPAIAAVIATAASTATTVRILFIATPCVIAHEVVE
jgi:hypothetical protein